MADDLDELIKEVAVRHGVGLQRDDPLLMLHTINERLARNTEASQHKLLEAFKSELEAAMVRLGVEAKDQTDKTTRAAVGTAEQAIGAAVEAARTLLTQHADDVGKRNAAALEAVAGKLVSAVQASTNGIRPLVLLSTGSAAVSVLVLVAAAALFLMR